MSRNKKDHDKDLDGFRRNVKEYLDDADDVIAHVKSENAKGSHDPVMNALTEAARKDPKWTMHTVVLVVAVVGFVVLAMTFL